MLPEPLAQIIRGFQPARAFLTAIELDLFTAVARGATAAEVARRLSTDPRATEMLLNALVALGLLTKTNGVFHNTADTARYLTQGSPDNERLSWMHSVNLWKAWSTLTDCVRAGARVLERGPEPDPAWTESFIAAMARNAAERAPHLVRAVGGGDVRRLLDIGGGPALYSIAFARAFPALRAEVLDRPEVLAIARRHIQQAGLADRIATRAGDFTTGEFGRDYDLILLSNICHILGPEQNRDLLRRCYAALAPAGRVVIQDFILNRDKTSPQVAALFALNMLVATERGSSYSEDEYAGWLREAGFDQIRRVDLPGPSELIVAGRPR